MQGQHHFDGQRLLQQLREWALGLGFSQISVADVDLAAAEPGLQAWLEAGFHGSMGYMAAHGLKRARPAELVPGTLRVISARMDYLPQNTPPDWTARERAALADPQRAMVSLYARGRDYHKVLRQRLQRLADRLAAEIGPLGHRVFCDSAPVLEVGVDLAQEEHRSGIAPQQQAVAPAPAQARARRQRDFRHRRRVGERAQHPRVRALGDEPGQLRELVAQHLVVVAAASVQRDHGLLRL
ncbi:MAG: DUF1730 domain-containing protein, partial [Burkholderiales bacterium]|nr:DUF1730 domain-containing protein [Burkholderiales bacterium]